MGFYDVTYQDAVRARSATLSKTSKRLEITWGNGISMWMVEFFRGCDFAKRRYFTTKDGAWRAQCSWELSR